MKIELRNIWKAYAKEPLFSYNVSVVFESDECVNWKKWCG